MRNQALLSGTPDGALTRELKSAGRTGKALKSGGIIPDGAWHRVGFVWDGLRLSSGDGTAS